MAAPVVDPVSEVLLTGAYWTGADMSCLMHMDGIITRDGNPIKVMHIVEILAGVRP